MAAGLVLPKNYAAKIFRSKLFAKSGLTPHSLLREPHYQKFDTNPIWPKLAIPYLSNQSSRGMQNYLCNDCRGQFTSTRKIQKRQLGQANRSDADGPPKQFGIIAFGFRACRQGLFLSRRLPPAQCFSLQPDKAVPFLPAKKTDR